MTTRKPNTVGAAPGERAAERKVAIDEASTQILTILRGLPAAMGLDVLVRVTHALCDPKSQQGPS